MTVYNFDQSDFYIDESDPPVSDFTGDDTSETVIIADEPGAAAPVARTFLCRFELA